MCSVKLWCQPLAVALVAQVSLCVVGAAQAQTTLRYQFKTGDKIPYSIDVEQKANMKVMGKNADVKIHTTYDITMNVVKVDDKGAQVNTTVDHITMTIDGLGARITIDSNDKTEPGNDVAKLIAPMIVGLNKIEMMVNVSELGESTNARFSEESVKKFKDLSETKIVGVLFTPESLKGMLAPGMVLPRDGIDKGKSWTRKTNETMTYGKVSGETQFTFAGEIDKGGRKLVHISAVPNIKIDPEGAAGVMMKVKDSTGKTNILFDNRTGRLVESVSEMDMQMEMEVDNEKVVQRVVHSVTYRLKEGDKSK